MIEVFKEKSNVKDEDKDRSKRLMAFTTAKEILPMTEEEVESITGAGTGGCTRTNEAGTLCIEWDTL